MQRLNAVFENKPEDVRGKWANAVLTFVGEVTHEHYTDFKDVSGVVRRQTPQDGLVLNLFDFNASVFDKDEPFSKRNFVLALLIPHNTREVRKVLQFPCTSDVVEGVFDAFMAQKPSAEGMIVRDANGKFEPGKRTWCYQKLLRKPTIDLYVTGFEEATTEAGEPKGMVGRVLISYKGKEIGCGPGKLTHAERIALWQEYCAFGAVKRMATIQYKEDQSYEALREPTFQHWRHDKDTPDA
jgi:ATP-dependent DNA ligase